MLASDCLIQFSEEVGSGGMTSQGVEPVVAVDSRSTEVIMLYCYHLTLYISFVLWSRKEVSSCMYWKKSNLESMLLNISTLR